MLKDLKLIISRSPYYVNKDECSKYFYADPNDRVKQVKDYGDKLPDWHELLRFTKPARFI